RRYQQILNKRYRKLNRGEGEAYRLPGCKRSSGEQAGIDLDLTECKGEQFEYALDVGTLELDGDYGEGLANGGCRAEKLRGQKMSAHLLRNIRRALERHG